MDQKVILSIDGRVAASVDLVQDKKTSNRFRTPKNWLKGVDLSFSSDVNVTLGSYTAFQLKPSPGAFPTFKGRSDSPRCTAWANLSAGFSRTAALTFVILFRRKVQASSEQYIRVYKRFGNSRSTVNPDAVFDDPELEEAQPNLLPCGGRDDGKPCESKTCSCSAVNPRAEFVRPGAIPEPGLFDRGQS